MTDNRNLKNPDRIENSNTNEESHDPLSIYFLLEDCVTYHILIIKVMSKSTKAVPFYTLCLDL